ncbi:hypothetical protein ACQJBY_065327 [Aegilops geniculata]
MLNISQLYGLEAGLTLGQGAQWRMFTFAVTTSCEILDLKTVKKGPVHFMGFLMGMVESMLRTLCAAICQDACSVNSSLASGTTALAALIIGRSLLVANAGDCRAVVCCRGKAVEMSRDHKPSCNREKTRIEASGGYVYDGYLNGLLNVARAIGDWHMEGMKACDGLGPLSAEPEVMVRNLTEEDEFLIIGCDGIWDVFRSQNAVDFARRRLQEHNDPVACCKELVDEAIKRKSGDNLSVVVVCFNSIAPPVLTAPRPRVQRSISAEGLKELQGFLDSLAD